MRLCSLHQTLKGNSTCRHVSGAALRDAARNGLILRNEKASEHLAGARRHLDDLMKQVKGEEPSNGPQTPLRKEGEV